MNRFKTVLALLVASAFIFAPIADAGVLTATPASTAVSYSSAESLTISVDTATLALSQVQQTVHTTTTWSLAAGRTAAQVAASFNVAAGNALTGLVAGNAILSSNVFGQGLSSEESCNTPPTAGSIFFAQGYGAICDMIQNTTITAANMSGTATMPFKIRINPAAVITPDTYSGTLFFFAVSM